MASTFQLVPSQAPARTRFPGRAGMSTAMRSVCPKSLSAKRRRTPFHPAASPGGRRKFAIHAPSASCLTNSAATPKPLTSKRSCSRVTRSRAVRNQQLMYSSLRVEKLMPAVRVLATPASSGASPWGWVTGSHFR